MSLASNVQSAFTRVATEFKAIRTLIGGSGTADISGLATTDKSSLVAAINEAFSAVSGGGVTNLARTLAPTTVTVTSDTGTDAVIPSADATNAGVLVSADKVKLDGIEALADVTDVGNIGSSIHGATAKATPVSADELGLIDSAAGNVLKKITAQNLANYITGLIVSGAPGTLDTLNELAAALGDDPNYATTITTALAGKQPIDADLTAIAALTSAADKMPYATAAQTWALATVTTFARSLLDDADAATARGTLSVYSQAEVGDPATDFVATFTAGLV
jgi:hypothetical protein